ncbi:cytochrome c oxidase subunit 3 [Ensifer sp. LCM 4579]|uniref:cytochrome c oxidase subunit 3 n=1 Tax=Ensifer sp. LCM 4579 TaxID=1848292 RepID=UPI0008D97B8E|nr:cytochrome c oxidase subunit 3 [Ensifer sp. LCM 4579]OHV80981.1 cytochrome c oxidase polypeptide III [Ensifer sp. LCM 4579]
MSENVQRHEPYRDARQQHEADMMGMYVFLSTEVMLFGGIFLAIFVLRLQHPEAFVEASKRMHVFIGAFNTAVLLTSSLAVAIAVHGARQGAARLSTALFGGAAGLGVVFLGLKALEYRKEYEDGLLPVVSDPGRFSSPIEHLFMNLYLVATALHATHLAIGILLLAGLAWRIGRGNLKLPERAIVVVICGLYWHFVDVVWVFLYPVLYLAR